MQTPKFAWPILLLALLLATTGVSAGENDILVLTSATLQPGLEAWKSHRTAQGHRIEVFLFPQPASQAVTRKIQEAALETARKSQPEVVLIAGSVAHVPAFTFTSKKLRKSCETDLPYGLPDPKTGVPALQVGRIPANDADQLEAALAKVIRYETQFRPGEHRNTIQFLAGRGGYGATVDAIIEAIATRMLSYQLRQNYHLEVIYAVPASPLFLPQSEFPTRTREAFEAGPLLIVYAGHGGNRGFAPVWHRGVTPYFNVSLARGLTCRGVNPLFFSITCSTGDYEKAKKPGLCAHLALEPDGPIATFGSSEVSQPLPNLLLQKALLAQVANARPRTVGEAIARMRADFNGRNHALGKLVTRLMQGEVDLPAHRVLQQHLYNLFGDPATRLDFPVRDLKLTVRVDGDRLVLDGVSPTVRNGTALVRYEIERRKLKGRVVPHQGKSAEEAAEIIRANHRMASDKSLFKEEVAIREGRFQLALDRAAATPHRIAGRRQWMFFFRVYAWNDKTDAVGAVKYEPPDEKPLPAR
jgi:hypothetical protein